MLLAAMIALAGCGKKQQMHQKAYDLSEAGNYSRAIGLYKKMLQDRPDNPLLLNDYGWALFMSDSLQEAKSVLQEAGKALGGKNELLRRNIKKNLHITESFIEAKKALETGEAEKALKIFDGLNRSWKTREMRLKYYALTHEQLGNQEKAREYWQQIIDQYAEASHENPFFKQAETKLSTP
mgnify:CR=1 FL=1